MPREAGDKAFAPGAKVEYWSASKNVWMDAKILERNPDGSYKLNCKGHAKIKDIREPGTEAKAPGSKGKVELLAASKVNGRTSDAAQEEAALEARRAAAMDAARKEAARKALDGDLPLTRKHRAPAPAAGDRLQVFSTDEPRSRTDGAGDPPRKKRHKEDRQDSGITAQLAISDDPHSRTVGAGDPPRKKRRKEEGRDSGPQLRSRSRDGVQVQLALPAPRVASHSPVRRVTRASSISPDVARRPLPIKRVSPSPPARRAPSRSHDRSPAKTQQQELVSSKDPPLRRKSPKEKRRRSKSGSRARGKDRKKECDRRSRSRSHSRRKRSRSREKVRERERERDRIRVAAPAKDRERKRSRSRGRQSRSRERDRRDASKKRAASRRRSRSRRQQRKRSRTPVGGYGYGASRLRAERGQRAERANRAERGERAERAVRRVVPQPPPRRRRAEGFDVAIKGLTPMVLPPAGPLKPGLRPGSAPLVTKANFFMKHIGKFAMSASQNLGGALAKVGAFSGGMPGRPAAKGGPPSGDAIERLREEVGLKLCAEEALPGCNWNYVLSDNKRRSFAALHPNPFTPEQKTSFFERVRDGTEWNQPKNAKGFLMPRKTAWMVKSGCTCDYAYGQFQVPAQEYPPWMKEVMEVCMPMFGSATPDLWPDSCNLNLYDDGGASVGWHTDDEKLFQGKFQDIRILSLSLGQTRKFELRVNHPDPGEQAFHTISLKSGDLMTMEGMMQKHYQHRVPKEGRSYGPRINLTWRWIKKHNPQCPAGRSRGNVPFSHMRP